ncbi:hypothetical protein K469DRAFT_318248 [Zopfia rhizophila CBS 207.26]|uniref:Uncharacterized protein n=1 Tax=Zopfia rhizophila CBS 207.26 TaxID=1314779 RepID=A0A6A6ERP3_9PEZI|nr:hypothetical protein K469DRAFT_318248 [Zopfia rhizophila CBS 207.26]
MAFMWRSGTIYEIRQPMPGCYGGVKSVFPSVNFLHLFMGLSHESVYNPILLMYVGAINFSSISYLFPLHHFFSRNTSYLSLLYFFHITGWLTPLPCCGVYAWKREALVRSYPLIPHFRFHLPVHLVFLWLEGVIHGLQAHV